MNEQRCGNCMFMKRDQQNPWFGWCQIEANRIGVGSPYFPNGFARSVGETHGSNCLYWREAQP